MPELKARCFVGLDGKFVMVSRFPDTEDYAGLHELLENWEWYDNTLIGFPMGHYELFFEIIQDSSFNPGIDMSDTYLTLVNHKKVL